MNQHLREYLAQVKQQGFTKEQVIDVLVKSGYDRESASSAVSEAYGNNKTANNPEPSIQPESVQPGNYAAGIPGASPGMKAQPFTGPKPKKTILFVFLALFIALVGIGLLLLMFGSDAEPETAGSNLSLQPSEETIGAEELDEAEEAEKALEAEDTGELDEAEEAEKALEAEDTGELDEAEEAEKALEAEE
ncbi:MAG TPA: hypothetical protein ENN46_00525, partial [Candidatus Woesearchaeota archaeon]|nr:hypothetical protein [Candidatus Woesearchaeota archaeon]